MGRYLASGLATQILIKTDDNNFNIKNSKEVIFNELEKYIDLSNYNIVESDDSFELTLEIDVANENIYSLINEIEPIITIECGPLNRSYKEIISQNRENYPIEFKKDNENDYHLITNLDDIKESRPFYINNFWLLPWGQGIIGKVFVAMRVIILWMDFNKYCGEDETYLLKVMNEMKRSRFKTKLSGSLVFFITS